MPREISRSICLQEAGSLISMVRSGVFKTKCLLFYKEGLVALKRKVSFFVSNGSFIKNEGFVGDLLTGCDKFADLPLADDGVANVETAVLPLHGAVGIDGIAQPEKDENCSNFKQNFTAMGILGGGNGALVPWILKFAIFRAFLVSWVHLSGLCLLWKSKNV